MHNKAGMNKNKMTPEALCNMEIIAVIGNVIVVSAKLTGLFTIRSALLVDECVACVFIKQN
jgi:hypothetical protein